jgi:putative membrane protein
LDLVFPRSYSSDNMANRWQSVAAGAAAGLIATAPMTLFMIAAHRLLPRRQRYELPPATITGKLMRRSGLWSRFATARPAEALPNHFAYGASVGAAYRSLDPEGPDTAFGGVAYALSVWAASYLGWLPAAGLHRSAMNDTAERNALMIAAHVVWGLSFAAILRQLDAPMATSAAEPPARPVEEASAV